ncbi:MAG TPA: GNAT family N-acetyltransferase [bacterium]|nr:GNAT family N-acetyltransferase [bacterium]
MQSGSGTRIRCYRSASASGKKCAQKEAIGSRLSVEGVISYQLSVEDTLDGRLRRANILSIIDGVFSNMIGNCIIRKAANSEIDSLIDIWKTKVFDLDKRGITVWNITQFNRTNLRNKYKNPEYYVGTMDNRIFGGFILIEKDIYNWPIELKNKAYYFHKFVISSEFAGKGFSKLILDWVKDYGKSNGKTAIRLDFNENREYLKKLYYGNGFKFVSLVSEIGNDRIVLAECIL